LPVVAEDREHLTAGGTAEAKEFYQPDIQKWRADEHLSSPGPEEKEEKARELKSIASQMISWRLKIQFSRAQIERGLSETF
jgi:hypothetical protein